MKALVIFSALMLIAACAQAGPNSTGPSHETQIVGSGSDDCYATLYINHDQSFENGFCWSGNGTPPATTYGAFAEGFDLGEGGVECAAIWVTQVGGWSGQPLDVYVWEGGVSNPPGNVIDVLSGAQLSNVPNWPSIGQNNFVLQVPVHSDFSVGYWADFSSMPCAWFVAADLDGFGSYPWTNIAPGIGYPTGWANPALVWGSCQSLGFGVYFTWVISPVESTTWGRVKTLF